VFVVIESIPTDVLQRKGASKRVAIPKEVLDLLNQGRIETVNLTEWLTVDHSMLIKHVLPALGMDEHVKPLLTALDKLKEKKTLKMIQTIGKELLKILEKQNKAEATQYFSKLAKHPSDSVRCWMDYVIGLDDKLSIREKLQRIKPFAADPHFGVREIAWMAVRESIIQHLLEAIEILKEWAEEPDANLRRFAVESTRPRGVWCKHIQQLKENPQLALSILEPLKSDSAKYVQDSVANWLNDASKSNPEWVRALCDRWLQSSNTQETKRIVTRALRTINKK
jgi:3-methyladenine DNA glycosylase AlkC